MARPAPESVSCFRACKTNRSTEMVIGPGRGCGTCPSGSGDPGDISRRTKRRRREGRKGGESRGESGRGGSAGEAASRGHDETLDLLTGPGPSAVCTLHPSHRNLGPASAEGLAPSWCWQWDRGGGGLRGGLSRLESRGIQEPTRGLSAQTSPSGWLAALRESPARAQPVLREPADFGTVPCGQLRLSAAFLVGSSVQLLWWLHMCVCAPLYVCVCMHVFVCGPVCVRLCVCRGSIELGTTQVLPAHPAPALGSQLPVSVGQLR